MSCNPFSNTFYRMYPNDECPYVTVDYPQQPKESYQHSSHSSHSSQSKPKKYKYLGVILGVIIFLVLLVVLLLCFEKTRKNDF